MKNRTIQKRKARRYTRQYYEKLYKVDAEETYNLDDTIVKFCLPRLKMFKRLTVCYPGSLTFDEWQDILQEIIDGFEIYSEKCWYEFTDEDTEKVEKALDNFREWFADLWW